MRMAMSRRIAATLRPMLLAALLALPVGHAAAEPIESQKIITALSGDFNGDDAQDLVLIAETEPGSPFEVHFFLRDKEHNFLKPVEIVRDQVFGEWNGYDRPGYEASDTEPGLDALPNGSILLTLPSMPIGPRRTDQTLTIAYRNSKFVVAGFAYEAHDYQDETTSDGLRARCSYNLLTGSGKSAQVNKKGKLVEKVVAVEPEVVAFKDWQFSQSIEACGNTE